MPFDLTFENRGNFLHARVTGSNTPESVKGYMNGVRLECEKRDCFRVLIEENLEGPRFDEMEIFALISAGSADARGFFEAIAYVDAQQEFDRVKFAENVAINRGIPIAVFGSVQDAENWLRHRSEDASGEDIFRGEQD